MSHLCGTHGSRAVLAAALYSPALPPFLRVRVFAVGLFLPACVASAVPHRPLPHRCVVRLRRTRLTASASACPLLHSPSAAHRIASHFAWSRLASPPRLQHARTHARTHATRHIRIRQTDAAPPLATAQPALSIIHSRHGYVLVAQRQGAGSCRQSKNAEGRKDNAGQTNDASTQQRTACAEP